jgi:hypothetical protein
MRILKACSLLSFTLLALTVAGPGSASASELCSTNTSPCTGTIYGRHTTITAALPMNGSVLFTNSIFNVTCKKSTMSGETTTAGSVGNPVVAEIKTLTFNECKETAGITCTAAPANLPYAASISANGAGNGSLFVTSSGPGNPSIQLNCGPLLNCVLSKPSISLTIAGGNPATVTANAVPMNRAGPFCPTFAELTAVWEITAPKPFFVVNP